jgi:hypothetical protein
VTKNDLTGAFFRHLSGKFLKHIYPHRTFRGETGDFELVDGFRPAIGSESGCGNKDQRNNGKDFTHGFAPRFYVMKNVVMMTHREMIAHGVCLIAKVVFIQQGLGGAPGDLV